MAATYHAVKWTEQSEMKREQAVTNMKYVCVRIFEWQTGQKVL